MLQGFYILESFRLRSWSDGCLLKVQCLLTCVHFTLSRIMMSGVLLEIVLSLFICSFHCTVTLLSWLISTGFRAFLYQCSFSNFTPFSFDMLKCVWAHTPFWRFVYYSFTSIRHAYIIWSTLPSYFRHTVHFPSASIFSISVACYLLCSAWSCAAIISLSVSASRSPPYGHRNVPSSLISYLYIRHTVHELLSFPILSLRLLPIPPMCVVGLFFVIIFIGFFFHFSTAFSEHYY